MTANAKYVERVYVCERERESEREFIHVATNSSLNNKFHLSVLNSLTGNKLEIYTFNICPSWYAR